MADTNTSLHGQSKTLIQGMRKPRNNEVMFEAHFFGAQQVKQSTKVCAEDAFTVGFH